MNTYNVSNIPISFVLKLKYRNTVFLANNSHNLISRYELKFNETFFSFTIFYSYKPWG